MPSPTSLDRRRIRRMVSTCDKSPASGRASCSHRPPFPHPVVRLAASPEAAVADDRSALAPGAALRVVQGTLGSSQHSRTRLPTPTAPPARQRAVCLLCMHCGNASRVARKRRSPRALAECPCCSCFPPGIDQAAMPDAGGSKAFHRRDTVRRMKFGAAEQPPQRLLPSRLHTLRQRPRLEAIAGPRVDLVTVVVAPLPRTIVVIRPARIIRIRGAREVWCAKSTPMTAS
jgi:hypothetical protein